MKCGDIQYLCFCLILEGNFALLLFSLEQEYHLWIKYLIEGTFFLYFPVLQEDSKHKATDKKTKVTRYHKVFWARKKQELKRVIKNNIY